MKMLLLIRHAKASGESGFADFERPLTVSGLRDAATMAARLSALNIIPQLLIASPSLRTIATANIFTERLMLPKAINDKAIYDASEHAFLKVINSLPKEYQFVGLVGHNPAISQVLYHLTGEVKEVPPCAVAVVEFDLDQWAEIDERSGRLVLFDTPATDR